MTRGAAATLDRPLARGFVAGCPDTLPAPAAPVAAPVAALVGRPDLTDETLAAAIAERLAFDGRTGPDPDVVMEAARLGKRKALAFLRKLVLPPPQAPLAMPVQSILRSHRAATTSPEEQR